MNKNQFVIKKNVSLKGKEEKKAIEQMDKNREWILNAMIIDKNKLLETFDI